MFGPFYDVITEYIYVITHISAHNNKLMVYVYSQKHNYIPYSTFTINKVQLHVSAIYVGHLQVVHETLNDKLYLHVM